MNIRTNLSEKQIHQGLSVKRRQLLVHGELDQALETAQNERDILAVDGDSWAEKRATAERQKARRDIPGGEDLGIIGVGVASIAGTLGGMVPGVLAMRQSMNIPGAFALLTIGGAIGACAGFLVGGKAIIELDKAVEGRASRRQTEAYKALDAMAEEGPGLGPVEPQKPISLPQFLTAQADEAKRWDVADTTAPLAKKVDALNVETLDDLVVLASEDESARNTLSSVLATFPDIVEKGMDQDAIKRTAKREASKLSLAQHTTRVQDLERIVKDVRVAAGKASPRNAELYQDQLDEAVAELAVAQEALAGAKDVNEVVTVGTATADLDSRTAKALKGRRRGDLEAAFKATLDSGDMAHIDQFIASNQKVLGSLQSLRSEALIAVKASQKKHRASLVERAERLGEWTEALSGELDTARDQRLSAKELFELKASAERLTAHSANRPGNARIEEALDELFQDLAKNDAVLQVEGLDRRQPDEEALSRSQSTLEQKIVAQHARLETNRESSLTF